MTIFIPGSSTTWVWFFLNDLTWDLSGPQNWRPAPACTLTCSMVHTKPDVPMLQNSMPSSLGLFTTCPRA